MRVSFIFAWTLTVASMATLVAVHAADVEGLPGGTGQERQVAQQCLTDLRNFEDELARVGFGVLAPGGYGTTSYIYGIAGTPRQKMQVFRDAAFAYAFEGDGESCQGVLASMRQVYQEHQGLVGYEADDPDTRTAWRRAHLAQATPMTEMDRLMRADVIIGADLRTPDDVKLGEIEDVVIEPRQQRLAYVLASRGGFLGLGEDLVAVRWADLRATADHEVYVLEATPEAFEAAPKVARGNFEESSDEAWRGALDQYWDGVLDK